MMANWSLLTSHARVLMCTARDPGARLRDIAASLTGTAVQGQDRANLDQWSARSANNVETETRTRANIPAPRPAPSSGPRRKVKVER